MYKKLICLVSCLALALTLLSGCSNRARTLVFKHWDTENQQVYQTLAEAYSKEHEGLTIEVQAVKESYTDNVLRSLSQKGLADVVAVPAGQDLQRFIDSNSLMDLGKSELTPDGYIDAYEQLGSRDGKLWAVPISGTVPVIFYNKQDYKDCSLVVPQTMSDFIVNCLLLQQYGLNPFALSTDDNGYYDTADFIEGILVNGSRDTTLLASGKLIESNTALDSGFGDAVGLSCEMKMSDLLVSKENSVQGHQALLEQFSKGAYAMIPGDTNDIGKLRELGGNISIGFFPMPGTNGTLASVFKADMMLGIAKNTGVKSDAEGFISFLLSQASQDSLCNQTRTIPAVKNITLSDSDLALAQTMLAKADNLYLSVFQRIPSTQANICLKQLDQAYSGSADDLEAFMQNWAGEIKAAS